MGEDRKPTQIKEAQPEGRRTTGRPRKNYGLYKGESKEKKGRVLIEEDCRQ